MLNIISVKSMKFSPLKTCLFEFDLKSSSKKIVSCEINGWMETHAKPVIPVTRQMKNCRAIRFTNSPSKQTNFTKLKEMKSSLLKSTLRKFSERTPLTAQSQNSKQNSNQHYSNSFHSVRILSVQKPQLKPIKIVEVSEFKQYDNLPSKASTQSTQPQITIGQRKLSLLRLRALSKKGVRRDLNHLILGKQAEIIQDKVTDKHYRGLKFVARKLSSKLKH